MDFHDTDVWIFDLDNTLYPHESALFPQIETRMNDYVMRMMSVGREQANLIRLDYWQRYGTTLAGLMAEHQIDPAGFLTEVHDIDFSALLPAPELLGAISALPGRKLVHTNADSTYARKVLAARGLNIFQDVYGVEQTGFRPKPVPEAYDIVLSHAGINPKRAAFFEDDPRNLLIPHQLGMRTVLVRPADVSADELPATFGEHVHHQTRDLTGFLQLIVSAG